jgi:cyclohexanecarboxyl-CoA dehydrogenase
VIFARTGKVEDVAKGISAFVIPYEGTPGIQRTRFDDVGTPIIGRGSVFFDDVRVPPTTGWATRARASRR